MSAQRAKRSERLTIWVESDTGACLATASVLARETSPGTWKRHAGPHSLALKFDHPVTVERVAMMAPRRLQAFLGIRKVALSRPALRLAENVTLTVNLPEVLLSSKMDQPSEPAVRVDYGQIADQPPVEEAVE